MLPDYLPGVHPLLVHFPIALLVSAALLDVAALIARRGVLRHTVTGLLVVGTLLLPLTYWTGRQASDRVVSPFPQAQAAMAEHADLAWWTLWAFVAVALVRLVLARQQRLRGALHALTTVLLVAATLLLAEAAEHGGRLVFDLGVGVRPVRSAPEGAFDPEPPVDLEAVRPATGPAGDFRWRFHEGAEAVLAEVFTPAGGDLPAGHIESREAALVWDKSMPGRRVLSFGNPVEKASVKIRVRRDEFEGAIGLAAHAVDAATADYLLWDVATMSLGARRPEGDRQMASEALDAGPGWHEIEFVAAGTHFRGYLDGELVVHGHGTPAIAGPAAIILDGTGILRLDDIRVTPIEE